MPKCLWLLASSPLPVHAGSDHLLTPATPLRYHQAPHHIHWSLPISTACPCRVPQPTIHVQPLRSTSCTSHTLIPALPAKTRPIHPNRLLCNPCSCRYKNPTYLCSHQQHAPCTVPVHTFAHVTMMLSFISAPWRKSGRKEHTILSHMLSILCMDQADHQKTTSDYRNMSWMTPPPNSHGPLQDFSFPLLCADSRNPILAGTRQTATPNS